MHSRFVPLTDGIEQLSDEWFKQRRGRLTGSKLANFCFIKDEEEYHDYYGIVFEGKPKPPFSEQAKEYMAYGRKHEDVAVCCFLDDAPATVGDIYLAESPFYKHTDPTMGASPDGTYAIYKDGKIAEEGVIEIKCPGKAPNRPYPKWKYYYVPQTFWEMSCSGHKKAITISWGPRNMRAWRYDWDEKYWNVLCNIVTGFRNHVPYKEFQDLQAELISESHRIANNAACLHPGKGWKQNDARNEKYIHMLANMPSEPKKPTKKRKRASCLKDHAQRDLMFAEVKFHPDTAWYKSALSKLKPEDRDREFVVMSCGDKYKLVPGYSSGEVEVDPEANVILSIKYFE
jgi:hypothetical protein